MLRLGLASATVLAASGVGLSLLAPAWQDGKLSPAARELFAAVGQAVLDGILPADPLVRQAGLQAHLARVEDTLAGFPNAVQQELALLLRLLTTAPGRLGLAGLRPDWPEASVPEVQAMLQQLRESSLDLRLQTYQALRDISFAAYFSDRSSWAHLGYRGPMTI